MLPSRREIMGIRWAVHPAYDENKIIVKEGRKTQLGERHIKHGSKRTKKNKISLRNGI